MSTATSAPTWLPSSVLHFKCSGGITRRERSVPVLHRIWWPISFCDRQCAHPLLNPYIGCVPIWSKLRGCILEVRISRPITSQHRAKAVPIRRLLQMQPWNAAFFSLFFEDAPLLSFAASHIPRSFARCCSVLKKKSAPTEPLLLFLENEED